MRVCPWLLLKVEEGIPVGEPSYIYDDNQSILANTDNPGAVLKKKTSAITYHFVRKGCVRDKWRTSYVNTHENVADLFTKSLADTDKRWYFVSMLLHRLAPKQYYYMESERGAGD